MGPVGIRGSHPDLSCELRAARGRGERTRFERLTALTPLKTEVLLGGCYTVPDEGYAKPEATNMTTPDAGPHAADAVIIAQTGAAGEVQTRLRTGCDDAFRVDAGVVCAVTLYRIRRKRRTTRYTHLT